MNNIILIGFMGSGKTSIGIKLSYRLRRTMTDTDKAIEKSCGMTVSEIFDRLGEEEFRRMETECLERMLGEAEGQIISAGGGLPIRKENRELLKNLGIVVFLRATAETICGRLEEDTTRPLLRGDNQRNKVYTMLEARTPAYEGASDVIIDVDNKELETIVDEIIKRVTKKDGRMVWEDEFTCN